MTENRTALSYWFPRLLAAGLPVPRTTILKMPQEAVEDIIAAFDGEEGSPEAQVAAKEFFAEIDRAASAFGYPAFLRTDQMSAKHGWRDTCFLWGASLIPQHVFNIAEHSEICDMMGLPWDTWAVREMLPTIPHGTCPRYGDMPVCREFRCFVDGPEVVCIHPYWPWASLEQGGWLRPDDYQKLCAMTGAEEKVLCDLASGAGRTLGGAWSVDILDTRQGWMVTDCAEASKSFHWEGCENSERFESPILGGE